jgi:signal transduction histidine kinase/HD-like signal output (HDOD) protein
MAGFKVVVVQARLAGKESNSASMTLTGMHFNEQEIATLFCAPQVLVQLLEACLEGCDPQVLTDILLQDAVLSARLIHLAHKTCPESLSSVEPISSAIQSVGLPVLGGIALQAAKQLIGQDFSAEELRFLNRLWYLSRVAGQAAHCIAPSVSYPHVEEAQLAGVLLPLGSHLLFARHRRSYVEKVTDPLSSAGLRRREDELFATDHLRLLEDVVASWQFDSFLVDAVRFLHIDTAQIERSNPLLKMTRLAFQFCRQPEQLSEETTLLAQRFFGFKSSEIEYLFGWARDFYQQHQPQLDDLEGLQVDFAAQLLRLNELLFILADQEGVRARLAGNSIPEELVTAARKLYLESSAAPEVFFLLLDQRGQKLAGIAAQGQSRLIGELEVSLDGSAGLAAQALLKREALDSLQAQRPLSVTDQVLLRLCGSRELYCQPLHADGRLLGVVVLGFGSEQELALLQSLRLKMLAKVISESFEQVNINGAAVFGEGPGLLRRVSHEVGNPLTIIGNYAEVLNHVLADSEASDLSESIKKEVRRIDEILTYYLNQQELPNFPGSGVCLNQLVQETLESLTQSELEPRKISVDLKLQANLQKVSTNAVLVKQILVNLIKNAAEAIVEGGQISLLTRDSYCSDGKRYAEIGIQDDGPGIDVLVQKRLFRPIVSTKGPGHAGVGLSIVKSMTDDLGGQISYYDAPEAGAGFCLRIPGGDVFPEVN